MALRVQLQAGQGLGFPLNFCCLGLGPFKTLVLQVGCRPGPRSAAGWPQAGCCALWPGTNEPDVVFCSEAEAACIEWDADKPQLLGLCNRSDQVLTDGASLPLQSFWQKLMHVLSGPSKTPTEKHYDDAKRAGGVAYDHAGNVRTVCAS